MPKTSTTQAVIRSGPRRTGVYSGTVALSAIASFDPTLAAQALFTLPAGHILVSVQSFGGSTGGASPTVDLGTVAASAGIANELPSDDVIVPTTHYGALMTGAEVTVDTAYIGGVGASAATGGSVTVVVKYVMADPKLGNNDGKGD